MDRRDAQVVAAGASRSNEDVARASLGVWTMTGANPNLELATQDIDKSDSGRDGNGAVLYRIEVYRIVIVIVIVI